MQLLPNEKKGLKKLVVKMIILIKLQLNCLLANSSKQNETEKSSLSRYSKFHDTLFLNYAYNNYVHIKKNQQTKPDSRLFIIACIFDGDKEKVMFQSVLKRDFSSASFILMKLLQKWGRIRGTWFV